jgi:hypothetical protein
MKPILPGQTVVGPSDRASFGQHDTRLMGTPQSVRSRWRSANEPHRGHPLGAPIRAEGREALW